MGFVLDDKITVDSLLTIVLAFVFIIQTVYLARQTNVGVRLNQANLRETWAKKFETVNMDLLFKKGEKITPDENEFRKLVNCFDLMRPLFKAKLLKPSDFAYTFIIFDVISKNDTIRKSPTYNDKYLTLQHIYTYFNKDYDMIDYQYELPKTSWYDGIFQRFSLLRTHPDLRNQILGNWPRYQKVMKFAVLFDVIILRHPLFKLKPPLGI